MIRTGTSHLWFHQTPVADNFLLERRTLGTKRATIDRMIGITFDVDHLRDRILGFVAERMNDHTATH